MAQHKVDDTAGLPEWTIRLREEVDRINGGSHKGRPNHFLEDMGMTEKRLKELLRGDEPNEREIKSIHRALSRMRHHQHLLLFFRKASADSPPSRRRVIPAAGSVHEHVEKAAKQAENEPSPAPQVHVAPLPAPNVQATITQEARPASPLTIKTTTKKQSVNIEEVGPEEAELFLTANVINRAVKSSHVAFLADQMTRGLWKLTHQGIAFDTESRLIDGQHRLLAILSSGCKVKLTVTYNADPESYMVIDTNEVSRSLADVWKMAESTGKETGLADTSRKKAAIAVYKVIAMLNAGDNSNLRWSITDLQEAGAKYPEVAEAVNLLNHHKNARRAGMAAGISLVLPVEEREVVTDFIEKVSSRVGMSATHAAFVRSYETLVKTSGSNGVNQTNIVLAVLTMRAILALKKGNGAERFFVKDVKSYDPTKMEDRAVIHYRSLRLKKGLAGF